MSSDVMARLRAHNPVPIVPAAAPIEPLLERLDDEPEAAFPFDRSRRPRVGVLFALAVAAATLAGLAIRQSESGVDVAAAVYRATEPGRGVIHFTVETTVEGAGGHARVRTETWLGADGRRARTVQTRGALIQELAIDGSRRTRWTSARPDLVVEHVGAGAAAMPLDPLTALRRAYRAGRVRTLGRTTVNGRPAWRLAVADPLLSDSGHRPPGILIVDAATFVPIQEDGVSGSALAGLRPGARLRVLTRFVVFQRLPDTAATRALLRLPPHRGARVIAAP